MQGESIWMSWNDDLVNETEISSFHAIKNWINVIVGKQIGSEVVEFYGDLENTTKDYKTMLGSIISHFQTNCYARKIGRYEMNYCYNTQNFFTALFLHVFFSLEDSS